MEFLKDVLGEDLYNQVSAKLEGNKDVKLANLASGEYVSKARYDADLKAKDQRITELTDSVKAFDGVDVKKLQADVENWQTKYKQDLDNERINSAIQLAIAKSGARSDRALLGLLDRTKIALDKDGKLTGLDDQIEQIKKEDAFLFETDPEPTQPVKLGGEHYGSSKSEPETLAGAIASHYKN